MRVLLLNIDSKLPNIALKKIEMWHELQGDEVIWDMPLMLRTSGKAYASCIFTKNASVVANYKGLHPDLIAGGTGYDLMVKLPPEIDAMKPKINYGFTTRGCIRECPFCVVPRKEGGIRVEGDLLDLWDGEAKTVVLYDNNILALPKHFEKICRQARDKNIRLDFNQGLDYRLLTQSVIDLLKSIRHTEYRFAFDRKGMADGVSEAIELLKANGINRCLWYVLVGFNSNMADDLYRLNFLKERNQNAFVQRYRGGKENTDLIPLAQWANQHHMFHGMTWGQFVNLPRNKQYRRLENAGGGE